jgi:hypothetical protein
LVMVVGGIILLMGDFAPLGASQKTPFPFRH